MSKENREIKPMGASHDKKELNRDIKFFLFMAKGKVPIEQC